MNLAKAERYRTDLIKIDQIEITKEVRVCIKALHRFGRIPEKQALRNGTQISLSSCKNKTIRSFIRSLSEVINRNIHESWEYSGIWSIRLNEGGYMAPHIHPAGRVSGVCYIEIPDNTSALLQLGEFAEQTIIPAAGKVVIFPSWLRHGTTEYKGKIPRIALGFDIRIHLASDIDEIHPTSDNA